MEPKITGLVQGLIKEVIRADMTMHASQIEAWAWMTKHQPDGELIPEDIFKGFPRNRYLALNEINLHLNIKPISVESYWKRFRFGMKLIFAGSAIRSDRANYFEICGPGEKKAQTINIKVKRLDNGTIQADYTPADARTAGIMQE